jgi:hypothetical protein
VNAPACDQTLAHWLIERFRHDLIAFGKAIPGCDAMDGILRTESLKEEQLRKVDSHGAGDALLNKDHS